VQTIAERTTKLRVGQKKDAVNLLKPQLDALKADLNALKTKLEMVMYSAKLTEHPSLVPVPPTTSQLLLEDTWSQGNTWLRGETVSDPSTIPIVDQSSPGDTWTRDERISDFSVPPTVSRSTNEDTWIRDDDTPHSPDWGKGSTQLTGVVFSQRETSDSGRTRRVASSFSVHLASLGRARVAVTDHHTHSPNYSQCTAFTG
jgi:hypothetical protein